VLAAILLVSLLADPGARLSQGVPQAPAARPAVAREELIAFMRGGRLLVVRPDGTGERQATEADLQYDRPLAWDAAGGRVFVWLDPNGWRVGAVDVATGKIDDLTPAAADCRMARASPDGRLVAFMQGSEGLCVMRADGSERRVLSPLGHRDEAPAWSPDSRWLAFTDLRAVGEDRVDLDVHVIAAERGAARRVVVSAEQPAWSADGRTLFVIARRGGQRDVVAVEVASGKERKVTDDAAAEADLVLSPDRRRLAFVVAKGHEQALTVLDVDGQDRRTVAIVRGRPQPATWSPDSRKLAFVSLPEGAAEDARDDPLLFTVGVEGGPVTQVTKQAAEWPAWRPRR
jgi:TolB protein